jgi:hypothetical protein
VFIRDYPYPLSYFLFPKFRYINTVNVALPDSAIKIRSHGHRQKFTKITSNVLKRRPIYILRGAVNCVNFIFMKQYVIDELRRKDYELIKAYLEENFLSSDMDGIYWMRLDQEILTEIQKEHGDCQPFYVAVDLKPNLITFEMLIRTQNRMRCDCMGYATDTQRNWLIRLADNMFDELGITT